MIRFESINCNKGYGRIILSNRDKCMYGFDNLREYILQDEHLESITYNPDRDLVVIKIGDTITLATPEGLYYQSDVCHKALCLI